MSMLKITSCNLLRVFCGLISRKDTNSHFITCNTDIKNRVAPVLHLLLKLQHGFVNPCCTCVALWLKALFYAVYVLQHVCCTCVAIFFVRSHSCATRPLYIRSI